MNQLTEREFKLLSDYIKKNYGISLGEEKKSLIYSRLRLTLEEKGMENFTKYYEYLISDKSGKATIDFIDKISTNHTFFMREAEHFTYFKEIVLPKIRKEYGGTKDLRLWCCGCSSGEEAYTLEMIAKDYFEEINENWNTQILATDISEKVLNKGIQGVYPNDSVKRLPDNWVRKYFLKYDDNNFIVNEQVKKEILFRKLNLMDPVFPFKKLFQVIFCRNVMIYFENDVRSTLAKKFYELTEKGGYLFIGQAESLNYTGAKYEYVAPAIYKKER